MSECTPLLVCVCVVLKSVRVCGVEKCVCVCVCVPRACVQESDCTPLHVKCCCMCMSVCVCVVIACLLSYSIRATLFKTKRASFRKKFWSAGDHSF